MARKELNSKQREVLADKLTDLGNIAIGSLVFGVVVKSEIFNTGSLVVGVIIFSAAYWYSLRTLR